MFTRSLTGGGDGQYTKTHANNNAPVSKPGISQAVFQLCLLYSVRLEVGLSIGQ
jgi:hypothetical protein